MKGLTLLNLSHVRDYFRKLDANRLHEDFAESFDCAESLDTLQLPYSISKPRGPKPTLLNNLQIFWGRSVMAYKAMLPWYQIKPKDPG